MGRTKSTRRKRKPNSRKTQKKNTPLKVGVGGLLILGILAAASIYGLNTWERVHISHIEVTGTQITSTDSIKRAITSQLDQKRWKVLQSRSIAFLPERHIEQTVSAELPRVKAMDITRIPPNKIRVQVNEHTPLLQYCEEQCYVVSRSGITIDTISTQSQKSLPQLSGYSPSISDSDPLGERVLTKREAQWMYTIVSQLQKQLDITVTRIKVQERFKENIQRIRVYVENGYYLKIDRETDVLHQIRVLEAVFANTLSEEQQNDLTYIDIRIKNRVYYK